MATPPHVPALAADYERAPKTRVVPWFRVGHGVPYKVADGDNFDILAVFAGMATWDLIYYNFATRDPREVNWYLRNYTGCRLRTWDDKNFRFSDDADPGIIFFPPWAYRRLIAAGHRPKPFFFEDDDYLVPGVPAVYQGMGPTCWAGATTSMLRWQRGGSHAIADQVEEAGSVWRKKFTDREWLYAWEMKRFTSACGLVGMDHPPSDPWDWARLLRRHGPLMVIQDVSREYNHWVVIDAFRVRAPSTFELKVMDPGNSSRQYLPGDEIREAANDVHGPWRRLYHW